MADKKIVSRDDVLKMADLSRLRVNEEEQKIFAGQFQDILGYMDTLASVDTDGIEPLYSTALHTGVLRDDVVAASLARKKALANAPQSNGECFVVPRIV
ncbi:MAG: Asp-tRNA(Asn)/Glu-tRNA(Gln) amidotransferase subunit GatC [Desulfovibrio sp.]|jgi:aspartyl-tRNA(Asn)/glutamyl-tRNA(Gln) amidotransferase subunit C|nr:Asp-tRNA(Asn)/Glu-tRNA(Gln) amidotransferase subunit GatC [Desulfovibrio sp.]